MELHNGTYDHRQGDILVQYNHNTENISKIGGALQELPLLVWHCWCSYYSYSDWIQCWCWGGKSHHYNIIADPKVEVEYTFVHIILCNNTAKYANDTLSATDS